MTLQMIFDHEHSEECGQFKLAFEFKAICVIGNEVMIKAKFQDDVKMGNVLTGESYNKDDYLPTLAIKYCPWCGKYIYLPSICSRCVHRLNCLPIHKENADEFDECEKFSDGYIIGGNEGDIMNKPLDQDERNNPWNQ